MRPADAHRIARHRLPAVLAALGLWLGLGSPAAALDLLTGDAVVADPDERGVFVLDLATGVATGISVGGDLLYPSGVAVDPAGQVFVADPDANAILHVDPGDGSQSVVCAGAPLLQPTGVAVAPGGALLVADPVANAIFELSPGDCSAQVVHSGSPLRFPSGVRVEPDGDILVADPDVNAVFRFPNGSPPELVTSDDLLRSPRGVALEQDEPLIVDPVSRRLVRVTAGAQALELEVDALLFPHDVDVVTLPEPGAIAGLASGLAVLGLLVRRGRGRARCSRLA